MTEWKAIPGFDGWYEVSSAGEVRSWRKRGKGSGSRRHEPIHLRQARDMGVSRATMSKWINYRTYRRRIRGQEGTK